jgi:hypothetical protein
LPSICSRICASGSCARVRARACFCAGRQRLCLLVDQARGEHPALLEPGLDARQVDSRQDQREAGQEDQHPLALAQRVQALRPLLPELAHRALPDFATSRSDVAMRNSR